MRLYTIGFTQKRAEEFFELLRTNGVRRWLISVLIRVGSFLLLPNKKIYPIS